MRVNFGQCFILKKNIKTSNPFSFCFSKRDWVCEHGKKVPISSATFFAGSIVGTLLFGSLADLFGRVPALIGELLKPTS